MAKRLTAGEYSPEMRGTERLYFADPLLFEFEARVVEVRVQSGAPIVFLDRSAFYPEGGGQLPDRGTIGGAPVVDVQVDDAGAVGHTLGGDAPPPGELVHCELDRTRRRDHMALHTGQHILSRALGEVSGAQTVSARLGTTACTIDLDLASLPDSLIADAEALANRVIDEDVAIRAWFPTPDELSSLPLRRGPKVEGDVRIVAIGDFDFTPCGGTHCAHSSQVGSVWVTSAERYKGGTRVAFASGPRARRLLMEEAALLRALGRELTCGPSDVAASVDKLRRELGGAREELGRARAILADHAAEALVSRAAGGPAGPVVARLDGASPELARSVAQRVARVPGVVAIIAATGNEGQFVVALRSEQSAFDCGAFVKRLASALGGRGGGRPERAEGRLPLDADFESAARAALGEPA